MNRDTALRVWREVCGSDPVVAMGVVTERMLEDFAARIAAAERERCARLCEYLVVVLGLPDSPRYEGDEGPAERRVALALAAAIRRA